MAKYRLNQTAWINETLLEPGTEIDFDGQPGPHMEPLDDEAREALAAYYEANPGATLDLIGSLPIAPVTPHRAAPTDDTNWERLA